MLVVSRKLLRWLVRLTVLLTIFSIFVFVSDLWYDFLPSSIQTRLPLHPPDPVLIDIRIKECNLFSSCEMSGSSWHKIPKDLFLGQSWTNKAFMHTKSFNENELAAGQDVILNLAVGKFSSKDPDSKIPEEVRKDLSLLVDDPAFFEDSQGAFKLATDHGWSMEDESHGLWVKRGKHIPDGTVTAVKILYGEDAKYPLPNWHICALPLTINGALGLEPRLAYRLGRHADFVVPKLKFNRDGKLKIVQLADLHMSTGPGKCDHPVPPVTNLETCKADELTGEFVDSVLQLEKPDYVVFSGDQIFGSNSPDPETSLLKAFAPVIERKIPFSVVWGNHDNQGPLDNKGLMDIVKTLPHVIADYGPEEVPGVGNYLVTASPANSNYPALTLALLDSHSKISVKGGGVYDFIRPEQHEFLRSEMNEISAALRGYSHLPLSMAFFHIPLPEYRDGLNNDGDNTLVRVGLQRENVIGPIHNSGTLQVLREQGFSVVSVGHDHVNDYCQLQPANNKDAVRENVWLCYGGAGGFGGYGGYPDNTGDYKRRIRVFDIDMNLPYIDTWHRIQGIRSIQNRVRLVDSGVARYGIGGDEEEKEETAEESNE